LSKSHGKRALVLALSTIVMIGVVPASPALAYDGQGASNYAEYWWNQRNSNYPSYSQDCANFVSQALHSGGGFSYVNRLAYAQDDHNWWAWWSLRTGFRVSNSFVRVQNLYNFLLWHYPGGYPYGSAHTFEEQVYPYTPDAIVGGDVLFYDFDGTGLANGHAALQVTTIDWEDWSPDMRNGQLYGNLVNTHTTDRHHAFWSLFSYNSRWPTTTVYFMHIAESNT